MRGTQRNSFYFPTNLRNAIWTELTLFAMTVQTHGRNTNLLNYYFSNVYYVAIIIVFNSVL